MARKRQLPTGMWDRNGVYWAKFRRDGRLIQKKLSKDFRVAGELLRELQVKADRGDLGDGNKARLTDIRDRWLTYCAQTLRASTVKRYRENVANILPRLSCAIVKHLNIETITGYRDDRLEDVLYEGGENERSVSPRTINQEVSALSTMLNWAASKRGSNIITGNPIGGIEPLPEEHDIRKKRRALSPKEVEQIFSETPDYLRPALRLFAISGIRHDELVELLFSDVDYERKTISIRAANAKGRRDREIPIDDKMAAAIGELHAMAPNRKPVPGKTPDGKLSREHVFVTAANTPMKNNLLRAFYCVCKRAGIDGAHPNGSVDIHSLRGTFCTVALDSGAKPKAVQAILGHATLEMTMNTYAKTTDQSKREALSVLPYSGTSSPDILKIKTG